MHQTIAKLLPDLNDQERLALLVDREVLYRENHRLTRLLKAARLRVSACVEDIDYRRHSICVLPGRQAAEKPV